MKNKQKKDTISSEFCRFLTFLRSCEVNYKAAYETVGICEKYECDLKHELEFSESVREGNEIAKKLKENLKERRSAKDIVEELSPIVEFLSVPENQKMIKQMENVLGEIRKKEKYHQNRFYVKRIKDE